MARSALHRAIDNSKKARQARAFHHYVAPVRPPANTYDPGLDAQEGAANRGLQDLQADTAQGLERGSNDYNLATGENTYQTGNALADIMRQQTQTGQDYATGNADRARAYAVQAARQRDSANAAGIAGGDSSWDPQAAGIRGANQGRDQAGADLALARANAAYGTATDRTTHAGQAQQGQLDLNFNRQTADSGTALQRAIRENTQFGVDTSQARLYQASASGLWDPPVQPANEHRLLGTGRYFHRVKGGVVFEGGKALSTAQFRALKARRLAARG